MSHIPALTLHKSWVLSPQFCQYIAFLFTDLSRSRTRASTTDCSQSTTIQSLDQAVSKYFVAGLSSSTHKTCRAAAKRKYRSFCNNFYVTPLPVSESGLCYFVACMGQDGLACSSIRTYLSGICQMQVAAGFQDPHFDQMPRLNQVLRGVKVQAAWAGKKPRPRLPITPSILCKIRGVWMSGNPSFDNTMLWAAATTTFFCFCRSGEVTVESASKYDAQLLCRRSSRQCLLSNCCLHSA